MPKNPEQTSKKASYFTDDDNIVSLKAQSQPLTAREKVALNQIYNESVLRLKRSVRLLNELELYLAAQPQDVRQRAMNVKQFLADDYIDADVFNTLKMLKRHFYVDITNNSIDAILAKLTLVKNNVLKTYKGLKGQLDIAIEAGEGEPSLVAIQHFQAKTYVFIHSNDAWQLAYYENGVKKNTINVDDIHPGIKNIPSVDLMKANKTMLMRYLMSYHARQSKSARNKVYISNIAIKKQNDPQNRTIGYVYSHQGASSEYFGAIHLDYRLLSRDPFKALSTLIHESAHRYAWVNDRGYYHHRKTRKDGSTRPYPNKVQANTLKAMNNADSYAYFVKDITGPDGLFDRANLPAWYQEEKCKPLPNEFNWSALTKWSIFSASVTALAGGAYYLSTRRRWIR